MSMKFTPVNFKEANSTLNGRALSNEEEKYTKKVESMPCFRDGNVIVTKWQLKGFFERLKFLFNGEIHVVTLGITQNPMTITNDNPFESKD